MTNKKEIREYSLAELETWIEEIGEKKFRAKQIFEWLWLKQVYSFDEMSNLSVHLRDLLKKKFEFNSLQVDTVQESSDGTLKFRFKTFDKHFIEGVLIPTTHRLTACISSQIGCSLTCNFCATGQMGRKRNLFFYEIFDQVTLINKATIKKHGKKITNIVYMGMGEPLLNYNEVLKSIEKITSPTALAMSPSRITVSTSGIAKQIKQLANDNAKFNLAVSLHASNNKTRTSLMPINETNSIEDLIESLDYYYKKTKNQITYEYILFEGINDSEVDAMNLVKLSRRIPSKVNIIEYNPVINVPLNKPGEGSFEAFTNILEAHKVTVVIRRSRGKDIDAACGQLANKS
jgi:23S rRNA (adenine2503-C2)-methyltransferase